MHAAQKYSSNRFLWVAVCIAFSLSVADLDGGSLQWTPGGGPQSAPVRRLVHGPPDSDALYLLASGPGTGMWKSVDKGLTWSALTRAGNLVGFLEADPNQEAVLYAATEGSGVFRSRDAGITWQPIHLSDNDRTVRVIAVHPGTPGLLYAYSAGISGSDSPGVWKSLNSGDSWIPPGQGLNKSVLSIALDPQDPQLLYAGTLLGGFFKSINGGISWSRNPFGETTYIQTLAVDPVDPNRIFAGTLAGVFVSPDQGQTWAGAGLEEFGILSLRFAEDGRLFAATTSGLFVSRNGGTSWDSQGLPGVITDLVVDRDNPDLLIAGSTRGAFRKVAPAEPWMASNQGLLSGPLFSLQIDPRQPGILYAGGTGVVSRSGDAGASWQEFRLVPEDLNRTPSVNAIVIDSDNTDTVYAGTLAGVFKSLDGGMNWDPLNEGLMHTLQVRDLKQDPTNPARLYVALGEFRVSSGFFSGTTGGLFRSDDGGLNWTLAGFDARFTSCLAVDSEGTVFSIAQGIWKSEDFGESWVRIDNPTQPPDLVRSGDDCTLIVSDSQPGLEYVAGSSGIFKSADGGENWSAVNTGLVNRDTRALVRDPHDPEVLYAATVDAVYETVNGGARWFPFTAGLEPLPVNCVGVDPNDATRVYSCPNQGGLWEYTRELPSDQVRYRHFAPLLGGRDEFTGIALVNLNAEDVTLRLTLYGENGAPLEGTGIQNPAVLLIPADQQRAFISQEIWGAGLEKIETAWIRVDSPLPGILGLLSFGNSDLSTLDGTALDTAGSHEFFMSELTDASSTILHLGNPNTEPVKVALLLLGENFDASTRIARIELPASGVVTRTLADVFGDIALDDSDFLYGLSTQNVTLQAVLKSERGDATTVAAAQIHDQGAPTTLYLPQYALGESFTTSITLVPDGDCQSAQVQLRFFQDDGVQRGHELEFSVPCGRRVKLTDPDLFGLDEKGPVSGYVEIQSGTSLLGTARFSGRNGLAFDASSPLLEELHKSQVFPHLAWGARLFLGVALINPGAERAAVRLEARAEDGELLGVATVELGPGRRLSRLLEEYFPELSDQEILGGQLRVLSDQPLAALALYAPWSLSSMMQVPGTPLN